MKNHKNITRDKLEILLPDYASGRLSADDKKIVERNISRFPDLENELDSLRGMFSKMENADFESSLEEKTRNISVKVNERLYKENRHSKAGILLKYISPLAAMLIISAGIFFLTQDDTDNTRKSSVVDNQKTPVKIEIPEIKNNQIKPPGISENTMITQNKKEVVDNINEKKSPDYNNSEKTANETEIVSNSLFEIMEFDLTSEIKHEIDLYFSEVITDFIQKDLERQRESNLEGIFDDSVIFTLTELSEIETLTEEEFKLLIKVIENEDFES